MTWKRLSSMQYQNRIYAEGSSKLRKPYTTRKKEQISRNCITILSRNRSQAAKKRYLFLSDFLGLEWTSDHERMLGESGSSFSLLDPAEVDRGIKNSRFGLKINIEVNTLMDSI